MVVFAAARLLCSNNRIKVRKGVAKAKTVKRMASVVLLVCFMLAFSCPTILAAEAQETTTIVPCEDGGYIVTTLTIEPSTSRASGTTSGSKTVTKYNVFDVKQYSFTVHGTFTYNGSAAPRQRVQAPVTRFISLVGVVPTDLQQKIEIPSPVPLPSEMVLQSTIQQQL